MMTNPIPWMPLALVTALAGQCAGASKAPQPERCPAQICEGDQGGCDAVVLEHVWMWNGEACVEAYDSGCGVVGPDCDSLYPSQAQCEAAWSSCIDASR